MWGGVTDTDSSKTQASESVSDASREQTDVPSESGSDQNEQSVQETSEEQAVEATSELAQAATEAVTEASETSTESSQNIDDNSILTFEAQKVDDITSFFFALANDHRPIIIHNVYFKDEETIIIEFSDDDNGFYYATAADMKDLDIITAYHDQEPVFEGQLGSRQFIIGIHY